MIPRGLEYEVEMRSTFQDEALPPTIGYQEDYPLEPHDANWLATAGAGVLFFLMGLMIMGLNYGVGIIFVLIGVIAIGGAASAMKAETDAEMDAEMEDQWAQAEAEREWEDAARARQEARQKEIEEIVKAVKATIRVRCRYCGTLNEETANKCESCGASL